jgi:hypothetical protein
VHGVRFLVFTEEQICIQPRLSNCEIMLRHGAPPDDVPAEIAVRDVLAAMSGESTIGEVRAAGAAIGSHRRYSAIMRLALRGEISLDLSQRFSDEMKITMGGAS